MILKDLEWIISIFESAVVHGDCIPRRVFAMLSSVVCFIVA